MKKIVFTFISSFFLIAPFLANAQIVPCGRNSGTTEEMAPCSLCHLFTGIKNIIDWGMGILVFVAIAAIVFSAIMYIVSAGNEQMMQTAKDYIKTTLMGFAIVLGAWLIVNTTMWLMGKDNYLGIGVTNWYEFDCVGAGTGDSDGDGIPNGEDNCPYHSNPGQGDLDGDGSGDACDLCVGNDAEGDLDGDGDCDDIDSDDDGDGINDEYDNCPKEWFPPGEMVDEDNDGCDDRTICEDDGGNCSNGGDCCSGRCEGSICLVSIGDPVYGGYALSSADIANPNEQWNDRSQDLSSLLNCMRGRLPEEARVISSISDSQGIDRCINDYARPPCAHAEYSCHYGGRNCRGSSYAIDIKGTQYTTEVSQAASECGTIAVNEGNHMHISTGNSASICGCN